MSLFRRKMLPEVHQQYVGQLPAMPRFNLPGELTPTLNKYTEITQKPYTTITAFSNALMGKDAQDLFGDNITIKSTDRPELTEAKKQLRQKYFDTMNRMYGLANSFVDRLYSVDGVFGLLMRHLDGVNTQIKQNIQTTTPENSDPMLIGMLDDVTKMKSLFSEKITRAYEKEKQDLEVALGEENKDSSYGLWQKSFLERAYADRLIEADYDILTKYSGQILDNSLKQLELSSKPLLMQMSALQQALNTDLEYQKFEESQFQSDKQTDLQKQQIEQQLNLERKAKLVQAQQQANQLQQTMDLERQKLQQQQTMEENRQLLQREAQKNNMTLQQAKMEFDRKLENLNTRKFYDQLALQSANYDLDNQLKRIQLNNEAEYRQWQTRNTPAPVSPLVSVLGGLASIGGGLLIDKMIPTFTGRKIGNFFKKGIL